jgi:hypothetical protein
VGQGGRQHVCFAAVFLVDILRLQPAFELL